MRILVVNAGSSSLKLTLTNEREQTLAEHELAAPKAEIDRDQLRAVLDSEFGGADAVGHRIVHGGTRFRDPVLIDDAVERALRELVDLAPLHQPKSLAALDAVSEQLPDLPAVACFDTAFHATLAPVAYTYALPARWRERWGLRRYGFHGLSHAWVARRAAELTAASQAASARACSGVEPRIVSCHLGAGASLCAIANSQSVDTTMGFTPLEGLVMATRSGSVDPGLLLWLLERTGLRERELADALEHDAGLLALAGTADMRVIVEAADDGDERAQLALAVYLHHLRAGVAAMAAALGGLDVLAFTGGVGEHAPVVRARAAAGLEFLGVRLDPSRNEDPELDAEISPPGAAVRTLVIRAREDLEISRQVLNTLRAKHA